MDHDEAPVLDALAEYHRRGYTPFTPPGAQARSRRGSTKPCGAGESVFGNDILAVSGLDDRSSSGEVLPRAQRLMADAVGAGLVLSGRGTVVPRPGSTSRNSSSTPMVHPGRSAPSMSPVS